MRAIHLVALLVALIELGTRLAGASPGSRLTLRDALTTAVRTSPHLAGVKIDVSIADAHVMTAEGASDWIVAGSVTLDATRDTPAASTTPQLVDAGTLTVSAGLTRPLPGGGSVGLRADARISQDHTALSIARGQTMDARSWARTTDVRIVFRQPLLRGWDGDAAPRTQLARTRAARNVAELEATTTAAGAVRDIVRAYWEVRAARNEVEIRRTSLTLAEEQLRVTGARITSGRAADSEALAVGQAISVRQDELAQAEVTFVRRSTELRRLIGSEVSANAYEVEPLDAPVLAASDPDLDREIVFALERNPELVSVRARGTAAAIEVDVTRRGLLPSLDLDVSAGPHGTDLTTLAGVGATVELQLSVPIGNRTAAGALAVATRQQRRVRYDEAELRGQVSSAVIEAIVAMRSARTRAGALADAVRLGDEAIAAEIERWQQGKSTNYDVMKRQAERADSALRHGRAVVDYRQAEAALDALTGAILPRYGIAIR